MACSVATLLSIQTSFSQSDRYAYAVTDITKEGVQWNTLRRIDLATGEYSQSLFLGTDATAMAYDALTKKQMTQPISHARFGTIANAAFVNGVAAAAYDKRHDRLYFTPMFVDQLRYIDLKTMKVYYLNGAALTGSVTKAQDQSDILTRMVIADDGNGYALSNDGKQLVQFTTGKKPVVRNLGSLVDDPANKDVSIHNSCTSYGGDIIADDAGNIYIFSARNHVFRVSLETKVATHLGKISGLPATFTVNGAAVNERNAVVLTSAVDNSGVFSIDVNALTASAITTNASWRTSDLANGRLLLTSKLAAPSLPAISSDDNQLVRLYPNPAVGRHFNVELYVPGGRYTIQVTDIVGRQAIEAPVVVKGEGQVENINLPAKHPKGVYMVNVVTPDKKVVFSKKILVQ